MEKKEYSTFWTPETQMFYKREKIVKCEGAYLYDEYGKKYIDLNSGTWNVILGYNRNEYNKKVLDIIKNVQFIPNVRFSHEEGEKLSKRILSKIPSNYKSIFFTTGGSEAVETAIKFAKQYWYNKGYKNKTKIISLYESYHGSTIGAVSVSGDPWDRVAYDAILMNSLKIYPYYCYKCRLGLDKDCCKNACLRDLEYQINFYGAENISSLIIEPIMGVGGIIIPSKEWLHKIVDICHKNNILVIFDEVTSGIGRCGNYFSFLDYEINPDIVTFGKCISNGMAPLAGTIVTDEIYDAFKNKDEDIQFKHGFTNSGHPLSCAIGNITLDIFEKENILKVIDEKSKEFKKILEKLKEKEYIGEIRVIGLMIAIELINPKNNKSLVIPDLLYKFKERGIIMSQMQQVVNFMPSICITNKDFEYGIDVLQELVEKYLSEKIDKN